MVLGLKGQRLGLVYSNAEGFKLHECLLVYLNTWTGLSPNLSDNIYLVTLQTKNTCICCQYVYFVE